MVSISVTQNFLKDSDLVEKLLRKSGITEFDTVMDIGAGKGIITRELVKIGSKVIAVEYDEELYSLLRTEFLANGNVTVIKGNILETELPSVSYKVFANIPFNITSQLVNKLLFGRYSPMSAFLIMQKEAAKRFMGEGEGFMISTLIKPFYDIKIIYEFDKSDFEPKPNVDVVLVSILRRDKPLITDENKVLFFDFVAYTCIQQKPSLKLRLEKIFTYEQYKRICKDLDSVKETTIKTLSIKQWVGLFNVYLNFVSSDKKELVNGSYSTYKRNLENIVRVTRTKVAPVKSF